MRINKLLHEYGCVLTSGGIGDIIFSTIKYKSDDEDGFSRAFHREPGVVEAWQTAAENPIPSELESPK